MAANDVVLLDSLVEQAKDVLGSGYDASEYFELFALDQTLKDYELSIDELQLGWVDGGDDGGIDGFYVFLDGQLLSEDDDVSTGRRQPEFDIVVATIKHGVTFRQVPLNNLLSSVTELFDFRRGDELDYPFSDEIVAARETFRKAYISAAQRHPALRFHFVYATRGDASSVAPNVTARAEQLTASVRSLFSDATVKFEFLGASELLQLARQRRTYTLRLRFIENNISREHGNYVVLSRLGDYFDFVTDETRQLRRYLFDANVRDYLGRVPVNRDIQRTLEAGSNDAADFWWLNNGVTLLASAATIAGKEITLDNVQIVNGLQTTESVYHYFAAGVALDDSRALLLKIIVTENDEVRDRIIKATNFQTGVDVSSLRATDKIQRDLEHYLGDHDWYYDRRKNYHRNQGRSADRIVSIGGLAAAVQAVAFHDPLAARKAPVHRFNDDVHYRRVFDDTFPLDTYLACVEIMRGVEAPLRTRRAGPPHYPYGAVNNLRWMLATLYTCRRLRRRDYTPQDVAQLKDDRLSTAVVNDLLATLRQLELGFIAQHGLKSDRLKKIARSRPFLSFILDNAPNI